MNKRTAATAMRSSIARLSKDEKLRLYQWVGNGELCACNNGASFVTDDKP